MILKFIFSDLKNNPYFFIFFVLNFAIGLTGFVALDSFKMGIQKSLKANSKEYLSADLAVSARRLLTEKDVQIARESLPADYKESRLLEMFTMVSAQQGSRLVQLKMIDESYPFYGKMQLQKNGAIQNGSPKEINQSFKAWVYPELLNQLDLKVGEQLKIGNISFEISDVILDDSTQTFRLASLAPKIYIGLQTLPELGLIQMGSTLTDARLFQLDPALDLKVVKNKLLEKYEDPGIQVSSPEDAQEDSGRVVSYLNDYLGLVSLVGFFLAMIGATFLFRSFLNSRVQSLAILNALGLNFNRALWIYTVQLILTGFMAAILASFMAFLVVPMIQNLVGQFTTVQVEAYVQPQSIWIAVVVSVLGILFSSLPYLSSLNRIQTAQLLQESTRMSLPLKLSDMAYFLPLLLLFYLLSLLQANSFKIGSIFYFSLLGSFLLLYFVAHLILASIGRVARYEKLFSLRQASLFISRKKVNSLPAILALAMAALLLNLIPQLKMGLLDEFSVNKEVKIPGLFLFDIQDEQVTEVKSVVKSAGLELNNISPLVRARILTVNGSAFEKIVDTKTVFKTREEEAEARFRNRGFNLSYRLELSMAEKIIEGQFFSSHLDSSNQKVPEISVEHRFADRLGFKLGDLLKFDIQGVEVEGVITSLRSVKWNSFQPNFFVLFQPGALDEAPKTWLASIPQTTSEKKAGIQKNLAEKFSNVSVVDIERTTNRILDMVSKMSWALQFMSFLSLMAGLFVIYSISREQSQTRRWDLNLNKILGAQTKKIFGQNVYEAILLGMTAAISGVLLSLVVAYGLSVYVFEGIFKPDFFWPVFSIFIITILSLLISLLAGKKILNEDPISILREN